ncbi:ORC2-domain-containing protein [Lophium mytilinum]|uniref:ORC2-domain-containing protein n=1 Tax=Lophium mytilinum TaxID=390894 RepID=A0A6A6QET4_9PEZI|nr:ORC2-domain-containing protein [Lophium mytilinum]
MWACTSLSTKKPAPAQACILFGGTLKIFGGYFPRRRVHITAVLVSQECKLNRQRHRWTGIYHGPRGTLHKEGRVWDSSRLAEEAGVRRAWHWEIGRARRQDIHQRGPCRRSLFATTTSELNVTGLVDENVGDALCALNPENPGDSGMKLDCWLKRLGNHGDISKGSASLLIPAMQRRGSTCIHSSVFRDSWRAICVVLQDDAYIIRLEADEGCPVSMKRKSTGVAPGTPTPKKNRTYTRRNGELDNDTAVKSPEVETPSKRRRGEQDLMKELHQAKANGPNTGEINGSNALGTPRSQRKVLFTTPTKARHEDTPNGTPTIVKNADRSARRKSTRRLIERTINGDESDNEALDEEDTLAQEILGEDGDEEEQDEVNGGASPIPETPSKRGRGRPRGRPRKERSPTPPRNLPPHEEFFWQNRPGGTKTSNNTLPSSVLLNHDEYFAAMQSYEDPHDPERNFLLELHSRSFDQWIFELEQGFNICLYGYGSKRLLTDEFASHIYDYLLARNSKVPDRQVPRILVVNGYTPSITIRDIISSLASAVFASTFKLPTQPGPLLSHVLSHLSSHPPSQPIQILLNSIDSLPLRRGPAVSLLAQIAAHPSIHLLCTADTPNFPLLWDLGQKAQFRFIFHDTTTFAPYDAEIDVVESVNELLGRSGRRVGGRDGVGFVLRSLPENARSLFRILINEQLDLLSADTNDNDADGLGEQPASMQTPRQKLQLATRKHETESGMGIEYRMLYHKAVGEFVCSNEVGFRTLLKEFHDHQMVESRKDGMGTERLWVPFRQEELEGLKEELEVEGL